VTASGFTPELPFALAAHFFPARPHRRGDDVGRGSGTGPLDARDPRPPGTWLANRPAPDGPRPRHR